MLSRFQCYKQSHTSLTKNQVVYENESGEDDEADNIRFSLHRILNSVNDIKEKVGTIIIEPTSSTTQTTTAATATAASQHMKRSSSIGMAIDGVATTTMPAGRGLVTNNNALQDPYEELQQDGMMVRQRVSLM